MIVCIKDDYSRFDYDNCNFIDFKVTILESKAAQITDQIYQTNQASLTFKFDQPFQILPVDFQFDNPPVSTLIAYILRNGTTLKSPIDLNSPDLTQISNQQWIKFDQQNQSFSVFTNDNQFEGIWTIVVAQSLDQFPEVNHYTTFKLQILPKNSNTLVSAYIQKVDLDGLMHIAFRQLMVIPENINQVLNGSTRINEKDYQNFIITLLPGRLSDKNLLNFTSQLVTFTEQKLEIQLNFQNFSQVSLHNHYKERISVQIYGTHLFYDTFGNQMRPGFKLQPAYLPQLTSVTTIQRAENIASASQNVVFALMATNFVVGLTMQPVMESMLGSIRHLQIIIHAFLLNLSYPAATNTYFAMIMSIVTFQVYDFADFFNKVLSLDPNSDGNNPFNDQFNQMGYSAKYIIQNFGILCFTLLVTPVIYLAVVLIHQKCPDALKIKIDWNRQMFYGTWIKLVNETFWILFNQAKDENYSKIYVAIFLRFIQFRDVSFQKYKLFCSQEYALYSIASTWSLTHMAMSLTVSLQFFVHQSSMGSHSSSSYSI